METIWPLGKLYLFISIFFAVCLLVIIAIMLDLWDGVYTARRTNRRVHSHKLRDTIGKMSEYWRFIIIGFLVDCLGLFFSFYILPFVTLLFGAGLIVVEIKSMLEHAARRRSHTTDLPDIIKGIVACAHEQDAQKIIGQLKSFIENSQSKENKS